MPIDADIARLMALVERTMREQVNAGVRAGRTVPDVQRDMRAALAALEVPRRLRGLLNDAVDVAVQQATKDMAAAFVVGRTPLDRAPLAALASVALDGYTRAETDAERAVIAEVQRAVSDRVPVAELANRIAAVARRLERYAETLAVTAVRAINGAAYMQMAEMAGVQQFTYAGPSPERTFCARLMEQARAGRTWTRAEIQAMDNGQGLPVESNCGGYRCKHRWRVAVRKNIAAGASKAGNPTPGLSPAFAAGPPAIIVKPAGTPITAVAFKLERGRHATPAREAIGIIGSVHGAENLPRVPVEPLDTPRYQGLYHPSWGGSTRPQRIQISITGNEQLSTMVHETGHLIDDSAIGAPGKFASGRDPLMRAWREAVDASRAVRELERIARRGYYLRRGPDGAERRVYEDAEYLLQRAELWARSYTQYIAGRSGHAGLQRLVEQIRSTRPSPYWQWDADDFAPIAHAIDSLFIAMGWLKLGR